MLLQGYTYFYSIGFIKKLIFDQFSSKNAKKPDLPIIVIGNRAILQRFLHIHFLFPGKCFVLERILCQCEHIYAW